MKTIKKKLSLMLGTFVLATAVIAPASANAAEYRAEVEENNNYSQSQYVPNAGDWLFPTLTDGDRDYFNTVNHYGYTRTYTVIVQSPKGYDYNPSISVSNGQIFPVATKPGYYRYDVTAQPDARIDVGISSANGQYSSKTYFVLFQ
ncbi:MULTISPECIES: hypothetical protein [Paenibacillus]|uniref:hypothetical protein n=1 Tax=Paenibacillus TaxID=44249 RepID=UPI0022B91A47|nr:hypothetical protein [Paenibacillus caseinilyticus]MCZ8523323.1 hypothetical protein [Paenibacillus caseinilyticus]